MRSLKWFGVWLIGQFLAIVPCSAAIISGPVVFQGHTYYLLSQNTWAASEAEAAALGGHLATINSAAEHAFLQSQFGNFGGVQANLWIGLNDAANEGTFVWVSGEPVTYTNFAPGEPNAFFPTEDYVFMLTAQFDATGRWNDSRDSVFPFGLNFPPARGIVELVPAPSSLLLGVLGLGVLALCRRRGSLTNDRG
jgi:hypothetical protein